MHWHSVHQQQHPAHSAPSRACEHVATAVFSHACIMDFPTPVQVAKQSIQRCHIIN
eukprot:c37694_g1_i1 orf=3-167(-)